MSELVNYSTGVTVPSSWLNHAQLREEGLPGYIIYQVSGTVYAKSLLPAGTDYSGTNFGTIIRNARTALGSSGGTIFVKGAGGQTYTFTDSEAAGTKTVGCYLLSNQRLIIDSGATITQANSLVLNSLISNQFFDGGGTNTNMKVFCYGWLDGNVANQGVDPGGSTFWNAGCSFYNTDHSEFWVKGKNLGKYGTLVLQGNNNRVFHAWLESATDSTNQAAALFMTGGSPESNGNTVDFVGALSKNSLYMENGGFNYTVGRVYNNGGYIACDINLGHDIQVDEVIGINCQDTFTLTGGAPVSPQSQRNTIGKITAVGNTTQGVGIGQGVTLSSIYRLYLSIGSITGINNGQTGNAGAVVINPFFSNITIGSLTATDLQGGPTQNYGLDISNGCDSVVVLGGYNKNNRSIGVHFGGTNTNIRLKGMVGWNPQPVLATPFDNTNFTISPWGAAALPTSTANDYTVDGYDMIIVDTTANGGTITLKDSAGTAIALGYNSTSIPLRAPAGTKIRFVTALPTAIAVAGDN